MVRKANARERNAPMGAGAWVWRVGWCGEGALHAAIVRAHLEARAEEESFV